jgi:hypothetical protein
MLPDLGNVTHAYTRACTHTHLFLSDSASEILRRRAVEDERLSLIMVSSVARCVPKDMMRCCVDNDCACIYTHIYAHTHTPAHHARIRTRMCKTQVHVAVHTCTCIYMHVDVYIHMYIAYTHTCMTYACRCVHTCILAEKVATQ